MKVFKFGGASVKDADAVKNVAYILARYPDEKLVVVVSAMGKTTNAFEWLLNAWFQNKSLIQSCLNEIVDYHNGILRELFPDFSHPIYDTFNSIISEVEDKIGEDPGDYDYEYDQLVSFGEILSTKILEAYLSQTLSIKWVDARNVIKTDSTWRESKINWALTEAMTEQHIHSVLKSDEARIVLTQGFIGSDEDHKTTTLGREGSDFSAAILAFCLNAESVTIWKDVPGVLNADPKWFEETVKLDKISYREAIELSYYGATVIHPKTIKPLENKKIPLYAKSFVNPDDDGTIIQSSIDNDALVPSFIFKIHQILISITPRDFSFIVEENLEHIFSIFAKRRVKIHLMQNSAINFSVCVDMDPKKIPDLIDELKTEYMVKYNEDVELLTIRHYNDETIKNLTQNKQILVDQRTRQTVRMVLKDKV